ncbi:MAG: ABC transporter permease subunit [Sarcina sp.]
MGRLNEVLYDDLNREYERKNQYLYEVAVLESKIKDSEGEEKNNFKKQLAELRGNKKDHPYIKMLTSFENKEKEFLKTLENEAKEIVNKKGSKIKEIEKLEVRLEKAKLKKDFYKNYIELTYDAELIYNQSRLEIEQIPSIIESIKLANKELEKAKSEMEKLDKSKEEKFQVEFQQYKKEQKEIRDKNIKEVKEKYRNQIISLKARDEAIKSLKRTYKENLLVKSFESKKTYNEEIIKSKKYEMTKALKQKIRTVDINVSDLRRVYPVELDKTVVKTAYLSLLLPGLGQLFNKQYMKSIIMFLGTIYIYLLAIPYALGFGNYKGDGIAGLITLAENGKKLDRSIIFMVEGIIAIAFLVIGFVIILLAVKDAYNVEKGEIKGIRAYSWCETKEKLFEDGIPYLISMPALIITIFIVFVPVATTILLSFTGMDPNHQAKFGWEGLSNYMILATGEGMVGSIFWKILRWTLIWTFGATTLAIFLGFSLALILNNERIKGKVFFRSIYLLPWAVPAFITIIFFSILSSPTGAITEMLQGIFGEGLSIKNDPFVSKVVLIAIQGWLGSSYVFLLSTGVLQSISKDLYEAADIDGATAFRKLTKITIPLVLFQTAPLLVGQYTFNFNNFSNIYLFNSGGPFNPVAYGNLAGETDILVSYIFKLTIENQYQALGAAITILISIALMVVAYLGFTRTAAFKKEK